MRFGSKRTLMDVWKTSPKIHTDVAKKCRGENSLVYDSIAFHAKTTNNANDESDKNLLCICDDKVLVK